MFIGHWAPAFLAAAATPESPRLGTLFIAAQLTDWVFLALFFGGVEHAQIVPGITVMSDFDFYHMPYSHSLLGTAVLALAFGLIVWRGARNAVAGVWAGLVVLSHWLLDLLVHRPDLTIAGGGEKLGWSLWDRPWIEVPLELGLTTIAFVIYCRATKGPSGPPAILFGTMLLFQAISWLAPQPTQYSVWLPVLAMLAFAVVTAMAYWVAETRWHKRQVGLAVRSMRR